MQLCVFRIVLEMVQCKSRRPCLWAPWDMQEDVMVHIVKSSYEIQGFMFMWFSLGRIWLEKWVTLWSSFPAMLMLQRHLKSALQVVKFQKACISLCKLFTFGNCSSNSDLFLIGINNLAQLIEAIKKKDDVFPSVFAVCKLALLWAFSGINTYIVLHRRRMAVGNESALPVKLQIGTNWDDRISDEALIPV